jgi:hypothetical protein
VQSSEAADSHIHSSYNRAVPRPQPKAADRRSAPRLRAARSARILDISLSGLSLETSAPLEKDRLYELVLQLGDRRMPVAARVVRLRRTGAGVRASLEFDRILETDRAYLEQTLVTSVAERMTVVLR